MLKVDKYLGKVRKFQYSKTYLSKDMSDLKSKTVKMTAPVILVLNNVTCTMVFCLNSLGMPDIIQKTKTIKQKLCFKFFY